MALPECDPGERILRYTGHGFFAELACGVCVKRENARDITPPGKGIPPVMA